MAKAKLFNIKRGRVTNKGEDEVTRLYETPFAKSLNQAVRKSYRDVKSSNSFKACYPLKTLSC